MTQSVQNLQRLNTKMPETSSMPQQPPHHHINPWLAIGIIAVLAGVLGYFVWNNSQQPDGTDSPSFTKEGDRGSSETASWKTYRNEEYGFEIKYPKEYEVKNWNSTRAVTVGERRTFNIAQISSATTGET